MNSDQLTKVGQDPNIWLTTQGIIRKADDSISISDYSNSDCKGFSSPSIMSFSNGSSSNESFPIIPTII